ncbi:MAG: lysine exporter LysO family protein [Firmicutes bacterium]|nr:lysine exporter LysO family protein [Bacillota bacterium]
MDVLILYLSLCVLGYFLGAYLKKRNIVLKGASVLQTIALVALVFVMGARIGSEDEIVRSLDTIGLKALVITLFILAGTVLTAFVVRKLLGFDKYGNLKKAKDAKGTVVENAEVCVESCKAQGEDEILDQPAEEAKSDKTMLLTIFIPVTIGILSGFLFLPDWFIAASGTIIVVGLSILLFFVGIDLGTEGTIVQNFKTAGWRVILFPFVMIIGTYIGSVVAGFVIGISAKDALCVASGFGWYTLAPAMLAEYSIEVSAISFMHNVMRELIGLLLLPIVAKRIGHIESTGLVGAGSMDVCLPIIVRTTSGNMAVYAFIIGVVLSTSVPIMVSFMMGL